jgi:hypothetical protein
MRAAFRVDECRVAGAIRRLYFDIGFNDFHRGARRHSRRSDPCCGSGHGYEITARNVTGFFHGIPHFIIHKGSSGCSFDPSIRLLNRFTVAENDMPPPRACQDCGRSNHFLHSADPRESYFAGAGMFLSSNGFSIARRQDAIWIGPHAQIRDLSGDLAARVEHAVRDEYP